MNTLSILSARLVGRHTACGAAMVVALCGLSPVVAGAEHVAMPTVGSAADVQLSDLNLSTPEGMRQARERLHAMAESLCSSRGTGPEPSLQPALETCVDTTVANALRRVDELSKSRITVRNSVTLRANVSLTDLDLSTLEGEHAAKSRLEAMARRLCSELSRRQDLLHQPDYTACLHDTLAGAWAQANVVRASTDRRTAQRTAP